MSERSMTTNGALLVAASPYAEAIEAHYARRWGAPADRVRLSGGRIHEMPAEFCVLVIDRPDGATAYASRCMSQPEDQYPLEVFVLARGGAPTQHELVEVVTATASYHRMGATLGHGHTVNIGQPWLPGSLATRALLSLPYLDGPDLEWCEALPTRFLWLIPITEAELQYKKVCGLDALEERFEQTGFDYLDPHRPSVVC